MTIEEKVKAYDEMMQRIKELHKTGNALTKNQMEIICPELVESEDEKIRKYLIARLKPLDENDGIFDYLITKDKVLAYLEKQKAKERLDRMAPIYNDKESFESALEKAWKYYNDSASRKVDSFEDDYIECVFSKGFREGFLYKEKQKEQKDYRKLYDDIAKSDWFKKAYHGKSLGVEDEQKEQKPILEVFGFKVGDAVRLKDGDGRKHIIKSFEEVEGVHGPNFYHVEFEDDSARDSIYPGEEYPNGYYTQMEKFEEEQKPIAYENDLVSKPKTSPEILKHYLIWAENSEEDCPYTWKELANAIKDGISALEQKPVEYLDKDKIYGIMNKLTELSTSNLIPVKSEEYVKIHEITSDVRSLLDYPIEQKLDDVKREWWNKGYLEGRKNAHIPARELGLPSSWDFQKEQKPAEWSEEDEENRQIINEIVWESIGKNIESLENGFIITQGTATKLIKWLKSLTERFNLQPKQEWSKEDEEIIEEVISDLCALKDWIVKYDANWLANPVLKNIGKRISWLKSLPQRFNLKPKNEWNEDYGKEDLRTRFAFYTYKDEDDVLYLSNVFVEETSRNKGFGTKILAAAEKVAETLGAINIRLKVKQDSPENDWYRKHGYGYMAFEGDYDWLEKSLKSI